MKNPTISIIVPVYNTEKYLHRCIDSILAQTYTDFELLLIDDGSTDSSGAICDKYAAEDKRIRVFHKENGGVSSARNLGLDYAKGEWITFVDSDDRILPNFIKLVLNSTYEKADLVSTISIIVDRNGNEQKSDSYEEFDIYINDFKILIEKCNLIWRTSPWGKLYKKEIIERNGIRFCKNMHIGEDALFLFLYMMKCEKISIKQIYQYCYYIENENSLTKRIFTLEAEMNSYENINKVLNEMVYNWNIYEENILNHINKLRGYYINRVLNSLYHNKVNSSNRIQIIEHLCKNYCCNDKNGSFKSIFLSWLLRKRLFILYDKIRTIKSDYNSLKEKTTNY